MANDPIGVTTGQLARRHNIPMEYVRRVFTRGAVPEPPRIAGNRVIPSEVVPLVEAELRRVGHIPAEPVGASK